MLFDSLRNQYLDNGSRYRIFQGAVLEGFIDWSRFGMFRIEECDDALYIKIQMGPAQVARVDPTLNEDDEGPWEHTGIQKNFSFRRAILKTDADEYVLAAFFPKKRRLAKRRLEEARVVVPLARPAPDPIPLGAPLTPIGTPPSAPTSSSSNTVRRSLDLDLFGEQGPGTIADGNRGSSAASAGVGAALASPDPPIEDDAPPSPPTEPSVT